MKDYFNRYLIQYAGLVVILFYYIWSFLSLEPFSDYRVFLGLSIVTDSSYLNLLLQKELIVLKEGINFSLIPYIFERGLISFSGIKNLWLMMIFYKLLAFIIFFSGIKKLLTPNRFELFLISIIIAIFFCIDFPPFADRYPRPQFSNIFYFSIFTLNLCLLKNIKVHNMSLFFYGVCHACLAVTEPWSVAVIISMSLFSIYKYKDNKAILYSFLGFISLMVPILIYFFYFSLAQNHQEYLGLKIIYESMIFLKDYLLTIFNSKRFIILFIILLTSSLFLKRKQEINIFIASVFLAPLPFLIIGKTIQSYHLIDSLRSFLILICITHVCYLLKINTIKIRNIHIRNFNIIFSTFVLITSFSLVSVYGNSWSDRAINMKNQWNQYHRVYEYLENTPPDCKLVSNDTHLNDYWLHFKNGKILPSNGFIRTSPIITALDEVKIGVNLLSQIEILNRNEIDALLKYATHNYYMTSRSTITASLSFEDDLKKQKYLDLNKKINSMQPWPYSLPNHVYKYISNDKNLNLSFLKENKILTIHTKVDRGELVFKTLNYCF